MGTLRAAGGQNAALLVLGCTALLVPCIPRLSGFGLGLGTGVEMVRLRMDLTDLLDRWRHRKESVTEARLRLRERYDQEFLFRGPDWGHPSNYAMVHFRCDPSDRLSFDPSVAWPPSVSESERRGLESAIACGIVDGLLGTRLQPRCVCALSLLAVGWDELMSSEEAFYQATKRAMGELIAHGPWELRRLPG